MADVNFLNETEIKSSLLTAVQSGDLKEVQYIVAQLGLNDLFLNEQPVPVHKYGLQLSIFETAILNNQLEIIEYAVDHLNMTLHLDLQLDDLSELITRLVRENQLAIIRYFIERFRPSKSWVLGRNREPLKMAARLGRLEILEYFHSELSLIKSDLFEIYRLGPFSEAVRFGQLEIVVYINRRFYLTCTDLKSHDYYFLKLALREGHQEVANYLIKCLMLVNLPPSVIIETIKERPELLKFLVRKFRLDKGNRSFWIGLALEQAILKDYQWLKDYVLQDLAIRPAEVKNSSALIALAVAKKNNLELVKFLVGRFGITTQDLGAQGPNLLYVAIIYKNQEMLDYLEERFNLKVESLSDQQKLMIKFSQIKDPKELEIWVQNPSLLDNALSVLNQLA